MAKEHELDVRSLDITQRFSAIFGKLGELPEGDTLLLINDFEPVPLFAALDNQGYTCQSHQVNGAEWHVKITRR
ncbi:MAG: DUF2249 domain-containing protein [Dehalococcoidia bacterium]|nr:DUF2249 domain-containing protein [Dehalococcoidia bacterium]